MMPSLSYLLLLFSISDQPETKADVEKDNATRREMQRVLEPFNDWVGAWRGVGQPKRGSSRGAWTEEADWSWRIDRQSAGLLVTIKDGKHFQGGLLTFDPNDKKYRFEAKLADGTARSHRGDRVEDGRIVLVSGDESGKAQYRLTFHMRHEDRMLLLIETKSAGERSFARVAEVGYTRKGGNFARAADAGPKCIVTDGRGSMTVAYKGTTYYVCCTGCRDAFLDDPERIIAEAAERAKKSKPK